MNVQQGAETVVLIGWNETIWHMIYELDASVGYGSKVISYSPVPAKARRLYLEQQQTYFGYQLVNFVNPVMDDRRDFGDQFQGGVFFEDGLIGSRYELEAFMEKHAMPLDKVSRVFILTDSANKSKDPDCGVVSTILHIRQILKVLHDREQLMPHHDRTASSSDTQSAAQPVKSGKVFRPSQIQSYRRRHIKEIPIVVEVREGETEEHCKSVEVMDLVDSVTISAQVLSMLAYEPRLSGMLLGLISEKGNMTFAIRSLEDYLEDGEEPPESISFLDATRLGLAQDELVLGWSRPRALRSHSQSNFHVTVNELAGGPKLDASTDPNDSAFGVDSFEQLEWDMNPLDKLTPRIWHTGTTGDRLAVLCERCMG